MIKLYHYSHKDFKGYIKPSFFGLNNYSQHSARLSGVKRSYFYLARDSKEYYFNGAIYCYIAEIKESRLYNLNTDPFNFAKRQYKDIFREIKKRGYSGLIGNNGFKAAVLFYPIKIKRQEVLTK